MSLNKYSEKRNFNSTTEPKGDTAQPKKKLVFVVQKHSASHLHYDFRLEMDGVLKSWAIPKGPSMNAVDKRLAIMVEDHPYDYKDFEGIIPEGNYGAGKVIVWDNGIYTLVDTQDESEIVDTFKSDLEKGKLGIILKGHKLNGEFSLVKLKGGKENAWLLIKQNDDDASYDDVLLQDKSVLSHATLDDL
jgi:DNA ligase D-like protein (predicted 3'-phosphoesterase)